VPHPADGACAPPAVSCGRVQVLGALATEYPANSYELLTRNCHTFCNELAQRLQVDGIPKWITRCVTVTRMPGWRLCVACRCPSVPTAGS